MKKYKKEDINTLAYEAYSTNNNSLKSSLYSHLFPIAIKYLERKKITNEADYEDIIQDTFIAVDANFDHTRVNFFGYFYKALRNNSLDHKAKSSRQYLTDFSETESDVPDEISARIFDDNNSRDTFLTILPKIAKLDFEQRNCLMLKHYMNLKFKEIEKITHLTKKEIETRIRNALKVLLSDEDINRSYSELLQNSD